MRKMKQLINLALLLFLFSLCACKDHPYPHVLATADARELDFSHFYLVSNAPSLPKQDNISVKEKQVIRQKH